MLLALRVQAESDRIEQKNVYECQEEYTLHMLHARYVKQSNSLNSIKWWPIGPLDYYDQRWRITSSSKNERVPNL